MYVGALNNVRASVATAQDLALETIGVFCYCTALCAVTVQKDVARRSLDSLVRCSVQTNVLCWNMSRCVVAGPVRRRRLFCAGKYRCMLSLMSLDSAYALFGVFAGAVFIPEHLPF